MTPRERLTRHLKVFGLAIVFGLGVYAIIMLLSTLAWRFGFHT